MPTQPLPTATKPQPTVLRFIAILLSIAGAAMVAYALFLAVDRWNIIRTWAPVQAKVVAREFRDVRNYGNNVTYRTPNYHLQWTFEYSVDGRKMFAVAGPGYDTSMRSEADAWDERFPVSAERTIRYDPGSPGTVSVAGLDFLTFLHAAWMGAWGLGIIMAAAVCFKLNRRMMKPSILR